MVIDIKIDAKNVTQMLQGYQETLPKGARRGVWLLTLRMQKELRKEIRNQGLIWRGKLLKETRARKLTKDSYGIFMPLYGKQLDEMRTHAVQLRRGKLITKWAQDKMPNPPAAGGYITVRKHPFIDAPFNKVVRQTKKIVEKEINKAIRRKGKR